jgi:hypothetical protein
MGNSASQTLKVDLRRQALARRDALSAAERAQAAESIAARSWRASCP